MIHQKKFVTISIGYRIYKMLGVLCLCVLVYSCGSKSPLTMRLFMQAGGATVGLPNTSSADSVLQSPKLSVSGIVWLLTIPFLRLILLKKISGNQLIWIALILLLSVKV